MTRFAVTTLLVAWVAAGCATSPEAGGSDPSGDTRTVVHMSHEVYPSVESLATAADAVVSGTVGPVSHREVDRGGNPEVDPQTGATNSGIPMVFTEVVVDTTLAGAVEPGATILVATIDLEAAITDDLSALLPGERVVLFLVERGPDSAPGISLDETFYVPLSADNGVFDRSGDSVTARSPQVRDLYGTSIPAGAVSDRLVVAFDDLRHVVESVVP